MMPNGWSEAEEFVREALTRHGKTLECLDRKFDELKIDMIDRLGNVREDVAGLKVKSSLWGLAAGVLGTIAVLVIAFASKLLRV